MNWKTQLRPCLSKFDPGVLNCPDTVIARKIVIASKFENLFSKMIREMGASESCEIEAVDYAQLLRSVRTVVNSCKPHDK